MNKLYMYLRGFVSPPMNELIISYDIIDFVHTFNTTYETSHYGYTYSPSHNVVQDDANAHSAAEELEHAIQKTRETCNLLRKQVRSVVMC